MRALQAGLPEIHEVLPASDTRHLFRLLEWVQRQSGENPEKEVAWLYLSDALQNRLVAESRREFGPPIAKAALKIVFKILLGQLGDAPRAPNNSKAAVAWSGN